MNRLSEQAVFLNVPYDKEYAALFTALIAGLVALGRIPRCALEARSEGKTRLQQIHGLLASCGSSIHDLSRVTLSGSLRLALVAAKAQRDFRRDDPFKRAIFLRLVAAALAEARKRQLIAE